MLIVVSVDGTSFRDVPICVFLVQSQSNIVHFISLNWTIDPNTSLQKVGHGVVICTATGQKLASYLLAQSEGQCLVPKPIFPTESRIFPHNSSAQASSLVPRKWVKANLCFYTSVIWFVFHFWDETKTAKYRRGHHMYIVTHKWWLLLYEFMFCFSRPEIPTLRNSLVDIAHKAGMPCFQCI